MAIRPDYWTFPISGSETLVVALPDREGLLLLNPTSAWLFSHADIPDLASLYADHFGITHEQAEQDIDVAFGSWLQAPPDPPYSIPPDLSAQEPYASNIYQVEETVFELFFFTPSAADELIARLMALEVLTDRQPEYTLKVTEEGESAYVFCQDSCLGAVPLITSARVLLLQELTRLAVPGRDFSAILHAGAIGDSESCLIIAGASFSGKSTLCAALMRSGLLCYADDSACLTTDYEVAGMPFAISLREGSWPLFPELDRPRFIASNLGSTSPTCTPNALVFVQYDPNAKEPTLEQVETFDALVALHESGFWVEHSKAGIGRFIDWLSGLPIYHLRYSGLDSAIAEVKKLLASPTPCEA